MKTTTQLRSMKTKNRNIMKNMRSNYYTAHLYAFALLITFVFCSSRSLNILFKSSFGNTNQQDQIGSKLELEFPGYK